MTFTEVREAAVLLDNRSRLKRLEIHALSCACRLAVGEEEYGITQGEMKDLIQARVGRIDARLAALGVQPSSSGGET